MKHIRIWWRISIFFLVCIVPAHGAAQAIDKRAFAARLQSASTGACSSGVLISPFEILCNAHFAQRACPKNECKNLTAHFIWSPTHGTPKVSRIKTISKVFDLAIVTLEKPLFDFSPLSIRPDSEGLPKTVRVLGYPGCKTLHDDTGTVLSEGPLWVTLSIDGLHGSSGSPVFDEMGRLFAVVDEAASFTGALKGALFGKAFELRAVRAHHLSEIKLLSDLELVDYSYAKLLELYRSETLTTSGFFSRVKASQDFLATAKGVIQEQNSAPLPRPLQVAGKPLSQFYDLLPELSDQQLELHQAQLALAMTLEYRGFMKDSYSSYLPYELVEQIKTHAPSPEFERQTIAMVETYIKHGYWGLLRSLFFVALILGLVGLLWFSSLIYVAWKTSGGAFKKLGWALICGILFWPISLLVFFKIQQRRQTLPG